MIISDNILKHTIFIIEHNHEVLDSLTGYFQLVGFEVEGFSSLRAYLERLDDRSGCLLFDVSTPDLKGVDELLSLSQIPHLREVLVISDNISVNMAVKMAKMGWINFIEKPFTTPLLLNKVVDIISKSDFFRLGMALEADIPDLKGPTSNPKTYLYLMEIDIDYSNSIEIMEINFFKSSTLSISLEYAAISSREAIKLMREDMHNEINKSKAIVNYDIMSFSEKEL